MPSVWWFEVRNTLIVNERCGRLLETDTTAFLSELELQDITTDRSLVDADVLALARKRRLIVYVAAYG